MVVVLALGVWFEGKLIQALNISTVLTSIKRCSPAEPQSLGNKPFCVWQFPGRTSRLFFRLCQQKPAPGELRRVEEKRDTLEMLTSKHKQVERHCKHTWKKEHDVPRDTSRVTCPNMSCTRPDFLTSIFPIWPSRRSFRLQQFSSACSSCWISK